MNFLLDHLWQSLLLLALISVVVRLTRRHSARVRLWLWRIAAAKFLLPFALVHAIGGWWGYPVRFAGDPPPPRMMDLVDGLAPWFSAGGWLASTPARLALFIALLLLAAAGLRRTLGRIHLEAVRARIEELRLETDPDDHEPSIGFLRAALITALAIVTFAIPWIGGAVRSSAHAHDVLMANTQSISEGRFTLRPAQRGAGSRYFVKADASGVSLRNITVRELTAMAYGVNRFFVRGQHFRDGPTEDWLVDSRYDLRIDAPVIEPDRFDSYAMRRAITRELAQTFGLEIYVNNECQKPCGKWGDRVLLEVEPGSWALVDNKQAAQASAPVTEFMRKSQPARAQLRGLLSAYNSGNRETLTRFLADNVSAQWQGRPSADDALMLLKQTGGFDILELEDRNPNALNGWVRARESDALMELHFNVESEPPHRISQYAFQWGTPPAQYFPARLSEAVALRAIRAEAASRGAAGKFSGTLLVARGRNVLHRGAYGMADREAKTDNEIGTRFRIGSMTKMFTAVAVLRLAQEGRVRLSDPVSKYLPELAGKPIAAATLHQLLTHTSGAGDMFGAELSLHHQELRTLADFVKMFAGTPLAARPGQRYLYSNLGYLLLGRVVERVSRENYYDYLREAVFVPAEMWSSGFEPEDGPVVRARIYERPAGTHQWVDAQYALDYRGNSASNAYSTIDDLHRFITALRGNRLLDAPHTEMMLKSQHQLWPGNDYGYGVMLTSYPHTGRWTGYSGVYPGLDAQLWFSPDTDYVVIALGNADAPSATQVADFATARLPLTP